MISHDNRGATAFATTKLSTDAPVFFTGPETALLGRPEETWSREGAPAQVWADGVLCRLSEGHVAAGALSFEPGGPAVMHRLTDVRRADVAELVREQGSTVPSPSRLRSTERPSPRAYADAVRHALTRIAEGEVEKVVLGRYLDVESEPALRASVLLQRLLVSRPGPYVFAVPVTGRPGSPTVIGASPELLVRRRGRLVEAMPLAGSVPRHPDPDEDAARRAGLEASEKDLREHDFVVSDIVARLEANGLAVSPRRRTVVVGTDTLWHLATPISGQVESVPSVGPSALHLAHALAPTPAVGGTPRTAALDLIREIEGEPRGYLAGAVGWVDGSGDGEFALTLRSGLLDGGRLRLFAGAGIVAGSDPEAEVRETGAKLATMVRAVGL